MRRAVFLLITVPLLLLLGWSVLPRAAAQSQACAGEISDHYYLDLQQGRLRRYSVYRPCGLGASPPALFLFHYAGGSGLAMLAATEIREVADRLGFLVVLPNAVRLAELLPAKWNDDRGWQLPALDSIDELPFVAGMVENVASEFDVDLERLYAAGLANGGGLALSLACRGGELLEAHGFRFDGVASVASSLPSAWHGDHCQPGGDTRVLLINGTHDVFARWCGARDRLVAPWECRGTAISGTSTEFRGEMDSVYATREFWEERLTCWSTLIPPWSRDPLDNSQGDGTELRVHFASCARGALRSYRIERGGHNWPPNGVFDRESFPEVGRVSREIDASELLADFFDLRP